MVITSFESGSNRIRLFEQFDKALASKLMSVAAEKSLETSFERPSLVGQIGQPTTSLHVLRRELEATVQAALGLPVEPEFLLAPALHVPAIEALRCLVDCLLSA